MFGVKKTNIETSTTEGKIINVLISRIYFANKVSVKVG